MTEKKDLKLILYFYGFISLKKQKQLRGDNFSKGLMFVVEKKTRDKRPSIRPSTKV